MPWGFFRSKDEDGALRSDHKTSWLPMTKDDDGGRGKGWFSAKNGNGTGHGDSWTDAAQNYLDVPGNWIAPVAAAVLTLGAYSFYQSYLRRFPTPHHIAPGVFRNRSLFGKVTSVGDGDGFHLYHTPGGRLAGWGWLRRVPTDRKQLKGQTISIRLAGVDAPEAAHFGRPAQPFSAEALSFLENYVLHRRVRAYVYKRDQYERVVATVYLRRAPFFFPRRDVGLELLRHGLAVAYEGKTGAEFGGDKMEAVYREAEETAKRKRVGMWGSAAGRGVGKKLLAKAVGGSASAAAVGKSETPMEYKRRMKALEGGE